MNIGKDVFVPNHIGLWSYPADYAGIDWTGWYPFLGQNRDSGCLDRSNFRVALRILEALPAFEVFDPNNPIDLTHCVGGVQVARCNHWAVGWCETIYVHSSATAGLRLADDMVARLQDYPVLDEVDFYDLESEVATEYWKGMGIQERIEWCVEYRVSIFAARHAFVPDDPAGELVGRLAA